MAIPIPNYTFAKTALSVQFTDLSMNNPTSWLWDFGDGTTSTDKNPLKVYPSGGYYVVTLTVTNADGTSDGVSPNPSPLSLSIGLSDTNATVGNYSIWFMSEQLVPTELRDQIDPNEKHSMISMWQEFIYPLLNSNITKPADVVDVHNELLYDSLVNELIAKLVAYEFVLQAANQFVSSSSIGATDSNSSTTSEKDIKKIETGPANVEWYPNSTADENSSTAGAIAAATKAGGTLDQLKNIACQIAKRLDLYLNLCGHLNHSSIPPSKKKPDCTKKSTGFPSFLSSIDN